MICMVNVGKYTIHGEVSFLNTFSHFLFVCQKVSISSPLFRAGGETDPANHAEFR